ncbi:hypothetical protein [Salinibacterium sp.]|uniref:hypothetical protein n=1 Tax=Salinibacterium sp. TaxID=1915057 RepID=UPI00286C423F|nr:hypothetical protein [Salinibacterium sp.]
MAQEERFWRLLRWYPQEWRDRNGAALVGTMLDDAERQGRAGPSATERLSTAGYGLGTRLDERLALRAALAALVAAVAGGAVMIWAIYPLATAGAAWVLPVLTVALAPGLIVLGVAALARQRGLLSEPRAVVAVMLTLLALVVAAIAQVSWGMGFDAADRGVTVTGLAAGWVWLFGTAWALGAAAIAVLVDSLLYRSRLHRAASATLAILAGLLLAPAIGASLISPYAAGIGAAGLALLTLVPTLASRRVSHPSTQVRRAAADISTRTRSLARLLAATTAIVSAGAVVYALTGAHWSGTADATAVMGQGITIALLSALPLLAAIGVLVVARGRAAHTWGPLLFVVLALAAVAVAFRNAPAWDGMVAGFAVGSAFGGAAIAWWLATRLPGSAGTRTAIAVLIGLGYTAFLGILIAPMLAFALPLVAAAFAIWAPRRPQPDPESRDGRARPPVRGALRSTS